ncbi:MAG TPA: ester cyclase [Phytomonospora sp.]
MHRLDIPDSEVLRAREKLVLDHFRDEVVQRWDDVLSTFPHPHYEIVPTLTVHDGDSAVRGYYRDTRTAFPDQHHEIIELRHSADAVVVEFWLQGTHRGPLGKIPATGRPFRVRMTGFFIFDGDERLVCERVYFDSLTMLKQLLGGVSVKRPKTWLTALRALRGLASLSGEPDRRLLTTTPPSDLAT